MIKKHLVLISILLLFSAATFAQQITRFAVVDTTRVYSTYFRDSSAVRNYEQKKVEFQEFIDRKTEELKALQVKKIEQQSKGEAAAALQTEAEITKRAAYLTEYSKTKNIELESLKNRLENSDAFYSTLYDVISRIAESDGYSMVLSLQQGNAILWYSPTVDITDKVIAAISTSAR